MQTRYCVIWKFSCVSLSILASWGSGAAAADKTGREVVEQVCSACHVSGKDGAPKIGDFGAWAMRAKDGLGKLAANAISGVGKMPAHGSQPKLSDLEISRAVAYMVSASHASDPSKPYASPATISAEQLVQTHCVGCHGTGKDGAPHLDNFNDWKPRLQGGLDQLVRSAISGHNAMPSRSGMAQLSDTDLRNAVTFMVVQSALPKAK
jgi:cytochrome c5